MFSKKFEAFFEYLYLPPRLHHLQLIQMIMMPAPDRHALVTLKKGSIIKMVNSGFNMITPVKILAERCDHYVAL